MAKIGIVIVNYNGEKYQNDCIKSLYEMDYQDFEIIVVDSASQDQSIELLKLEYPEVHILEQKSNVGFAAGSNIGIRFSKELGTEYTVLLNNDVEVDKRLFTNLLDKAEEDVITVPKIYYFEPNNLLWFAGGKLLWNKGMATHFGIHEIDEGQYDEEKIIDYAPACCMMIHNSIFDKLGLIDENVFMYYDDTDFCARLQENGISIRYIPQAQMWHKVSSASGGENSKTNVYYMFRNQLYYMKKHKKMLRFPGRLYAVSRAIAKFMLSPVRCKNDKYILNAYLDYMRGRMGRKEF